MAATVKGITCPAGQWTALATAKAKVLLRMRSTGRARLFIGAGEPAAGEPAMDYLTISAGEPVSLVFEDTTTNVRIWPDLRSLSAAVTVEVVSE